MEKKKVEDLVYPDVVEVVSAEQIIRIKKYNPRLYDYDMERNWNFFLFGSKDSKSGNGTAERRSAYEGSGYKIYAFDDITFPEQPVNSYPIY